MTRVKLTNPQNKVVEGNVIEEYFSMGVPMAAVEVSPGQIIYIARDRITKVEHNIITSQDDVNSELLKENESLLKRIDELEKYKTRLEDMFEIISDQYKILQKHYKELEETNNLLKKGLI